MFTGAAVRSLPAPLGIALFDLFLANRPFQLKGLGFREPALSAHLEEQTARSERGELSHADEQLVTLDKPSWIVRNSLQAVPMARLFSLFAEGLVGPADDSSPVSLLFEGYAAEAACEIGRRLQCGEKKAGEPSTADPSMWAPALETCGLILKHAQLMYVYGGEAPYGMQTELFQSGRRVYLLAKRLIQQVPPWPVRPL